MPHAQWLGIQQCSSALPNDRCVAICDTTAGYKGALIARCTWRGWAAAEGTCTAVMCPGLPAAAGTGSKPWPRKCKGAAIGATCTAQCATAAGYAGNATARCLVNAAGEPQWSAPGNQCVKKPESAACLGTPPFDLRRKAVWPPNDGCNGTASGQKCYADCWDPYQVISMVARVV